MRKLKNRQMSIPNGFSYIQPEIPNWRPPNQPSFDVLVRAVIALRMANPWLVEKHGWATDYDSVADEVEQYNVKICVQHRWSPYITDEDGGAPPPFQSPLHSLTARATNVVAGSEVLIDWLSSGAEAVPSEQSAQRAAICKDCPQNKSGDLTSFFTLPVAGAIRAVLNLRSRWNLRTPHDAELGVCAACNCPIKLKCHLPIARITEKLNAETKAALDPRCWILAENK